MKKGNPDIKLSRYDHNMVNVVTFLLNLSIYDHNELFVPAGARVPTVQVLNIGSMEAREKFLRDNSSALTGSEFSENLNFPAEVSLGRGTEGAKMKIQKNYVQI
jgi:hypothetical protein